MTTDAGARVYLDATERHGWRRMILLRQRDVWITDQSSDGQTNSRIFITTRDAPVVQNAIDLARATTTGHRSPGFGDVVGQISRHGGKHLAVFVHRSGGLPGLSFQWRADDGSFLGRHKSLGGEEFEALANAIADLNATATTCRTEER